ncbi:uncharacterized protein LOC117290383 [Asterias rubens]|uniref:uncharacterized protein LOC117290383 n=1 Tax=Asterias rubens TaxID=7604 RepID=UPI0014553A38|nr:uncharacterized protein LOC117290383 [Asterias rubens]
MSESDISDEEQDSMWLAYIDENKGWYNIPESDDSNVSTYYSPPSNTSVADEHPPDSDSDVPADLDVSTHTSPQIGELHPVSSSSPHSHEHFSEFQVVVIFFYLPC